ncbi:hypothetical protein GCM10007938_12220 [Vibrio zhanjiangensis]|uniref:Uncharacterized protein n=1 Tax=Vibrio zhanjiangensis TaxID=1046128 RepID=A0ABQ6EXY0_9VIBR|nr:hypothetical protein [Vibrio zhanjiangensis]GLT17445.1 hypothetical protein GCM10007938_12220 [Vibrio zhanjiangensis]
MLKKLRLQKTLILSALIFSGYYLVELLCPNHQHCFGGNLWKVDFDSTNLLIDVNQSGVVVYRKEPERKFRTYYKRNSANLDGRHAFTFSNQHILGESNSYLGVKDSMLSVRFVDLYNQQGNCLITLQVNEKLNVLELERVN